jgi:hypothetical protein
MKKMLREYEGIVKERGKGVDHFNAMADATFCFD